MKKLTAILLSLALCLPLLCPARAADASPALRLENGALTLEGLGSQSVNSVQLELTMSGSGARFTPAGGPEGSYGLGKPDGNKLTIYVDSPQSLNQGGSALLGTLELGGNSVTQARLTLLDHDLNPREFPSVQVRNVPGGTSGGNPSDSDSSGGGSYDSSDDSSSPTGTGGAAKPGTGGGNDKPPQTSAISFTDVPANAYYAGAVAWALENGVTEGLGNNTFGPDSVCTRGQIVTFLWRAMGRPAPSSRVNTFTDVDAGAYYYDAVLWAVENGVTTGDGDSATFNPNGACTRAQIVTFLWRANSKPAANAGSAFRDVPAGAYYAGAAAWAAENGITTGDGDSATFNPNGACTRAQCVTFLYRDRMN